MALAICHLHICAPVKKVEVGVGEEVYNYWRDRMTCPSLMLSWWEASARKLVELV